MNLKEAKQAWAEGKKVRKKNWKRGVFIVIHPNSGTDMEINNLFNNDNDDDGDPWEIVP